MNKYLVITNDYGQAFYVEADRMVISSAGLLTLFKTNERGHDRVQAVFASGTWMNIIVEDNEDIS